MQIEEFNCVHLWDVKLREGIETQVLSNLQMTTLFLFASTLKEVYWFIGMLEKRTKIFSSNNSCGVLQCNEI